MKRWILIICALIFGGVIIKLIMPTYIDSGFNNQLLREVSLNSSEFSPTQMEAFTSELDGNKIVTTVSGNLIGEGINATNITTGEMNFERARGGSLILGGLNNQYGNFKLRNENDQDKIILDKDGMLIDEGQIIIKNSDDKTVLDSSGLVSTANFTGDNRNAAPDTNFTDTTYTLVSSSGMNVITKRGIKIVILLTVQSSQGQTNDTLDASGRVFYTVHIDGVVQQPDIVIDASYIKATGERDNIIRSTYGTSMLKNLSKGSHYIDLRYKIDSINNLTVTLHKWDLTYIILGN